MKKAKQMLNIYIDLLSQIESSRDRIKEKNIQELQYEEKPQDQKKLINEKKSRNKKKSQNVKKKVKS